MANNINTLVSSNNGVQSGATIVGRNNDKTISNLNKAASIYSGNSRQKNTQASNESLNRTASRYSGTRRSENDNNNSSTTSVSLPEPDENLFNEFMATVAPYVKMSDEEKDYYYKISSSISANGGDASMWAQDFLSTNAIANVLGVSRSEVNQNRGQMLNYYLGIEDDKPLDFTTGATLINSIKQGWRQQEEAGLQEDLINLYKKGYNDNSPEVQQIVKQILQKENEMSYFEDSNPRMWTTEWAKNSLSQLAYMGVGTLAGTLGGAVGGIIGNTFFGPVGGVKGFKIGSGLARFLTYDKQFAASAFWNMKQAGVSTETALKYSDIDGFINGLNEAFLDVGYGEVVGGVGKLVGIKDLGGKIVPTIVSRVVKDGTLAGWLGSLLLYIGLDAGGEFVQESTQSLTSSALQAIAEATDGLPYSNNVQNALASAWEEGIQGFATGLFFSGFGAGVNVLADVKKTSKVKNNAIHSYSKEAYVNNQENRNLVKSLKLGGSELSEDNVTNLLSKMYDSTQSVRDDIKNNIRKDLFDQLKTIDGSLNENTLDGVDITTNEIKDEEGNVISGKKTEVKRKSNGSTYFVVDKQESETEDGKEHYTMRIANPNVVGTSRLGEIYVDAKAAEYNNELLNAVKTSPKALSMEQAGAISFTLDGETKTLTIESVNVQDDNASLKEQAIRDLMEMYSDYSIEWNNRSQSDNTVFSSIESTNPRNTSSNTFGLNYTDNAKTTEEQSDRAYVRRWLGSSFSENASENDFMATILQGAAKARGFSGQEFIEKYFTDIKESENKNANVKGYTKTTRDEITKQVKATIYAGKSADPTTFLHELNHAIILMGDNRKEFTSIFNKVKNSKQFMSFVKKNMDILRYVIGKTDDKGVYVLENGNYVLDEAKLQSLFQDANNWTRDDFEFEARLYEAYMRSGQTLNPTLTGFFRRVAETFRRIYTALRNGISSSSLNDEIVAYFDKLYGYDSSTGTTSVLNDSGELHDIGELRQETEESEVIKNVQEELNRIEPIDVMSADDVDDSFKRIKDKSSQAIKQRKTWAKEVTPKGIFSSPIGEVLISNNSIDDSLAFSHGANRFTASLYPQLDKLIENSVYATTSDRKGENRILLLSRFRRPSGEIGYVGIIVRKGRDSNIYYFHSVIKNKGGHGVATNSSGPGTAPSINNLIRKYLSVNDSTLFQTQDDISKLSETEQYDAIKKQYYGTDKYMIAPNGKASKLSEEQWVLVRTPNFIKWFGDWINDPDNASKVVDENGEPMPVYHTTNANFDTFKVGEKAGLSGKGIYFAIGGQGVPSYGSNTIEAFLNIRNPLTRELIETDKYSSINNNGNSAIQADVFEQYPEFDGVMVRKDEITVKDPSQIKSATDNNGEFSVDNDSILLQTAYHGSPNEIIGELSTKYMGTGEGQQIHGWGLYFAQDENVSKERYISRLLERRDTDTLSFDGKEITVEDYYRAFPFMATKEFWPNWQKALDKNLHDDTKRKELIERERKEAKKEIKNSKHTISLIETILANPSSKEALEARKEMDFSPTGDLSRAAIKTLEGVLEGRREMVSYLEKGLELLKAIDKNPEKLKLYNPTSPALFVNGQQVDISSNSSSDIKNLYNLVRVYALMNNLIEEPERLKGASTDLANKMYDKSYFNYFKSVFDKGELVPLVEKVIESGRVSDDFKDRILDVAKSIKSVEVNAPTYGSLLTVDIPEDAVLLDEDKRFSNQSEFVQNAVKRLFANEFGEDFDKDWRGEGIYSAIQQRIAYKTQSPENLPKQASLMLAKYGIEGITYVGGLDGRCFVIFTDEAIKQVDSRLYQIGDSEWTETAKRIAYEATSLDDFFKKYREQVEDGNIELNDENVSQLLTSIYDEAEQETYDPSIEGYFDEDEDASSIIDDDWAVEEVERPTEEEGMASSSTTNTTTMSDEVPDWFDLTDEEIASLNKDAETTETNTQELEKYISDIQRVVVDADLPKGLSLDHSRSLDTSSHARAIEFANILKGSKDQTIEFLKTLREVNNEFFYNSGAEYNEAVNEESYQAKTIRESAFNSFKNMSKFIQNLVYESRGSQYRNLDKITDRAWKIVAGQVAANPEVYMDLYSRASGNTEWSGENSIEARVLSEIGLTERDWNDLSYSKRKEYIQAVEDKDIRKKILTGDVKDVDLKGYIERTEKRAEVSLSEAKALEESQKYIIDENKKTILKLGTEAQNYQKQIAEIEKEKAEIQEKLERNVKKMENKLKNANMDTSNTLVHADLLKRMTELNRREAQYQKALRMWQKGSSTVTQDDLARIRGLIEDARNKIEELQKSEEITPEEAIKRLQNLYNAWKDAKTKETIDKLKDKYNVRLSNLRQTKNEAIIETRKRYMQIMKEREALRRIRSEKERLVKQIMKAPSANIAREEARQIKALQLLIDPAFRRGTIKALDGKVYTVAELKAMLTNNSNDPVIQTLTERQIERLTKTSLDEMTLAEVEDTYRYIKQLREEGLNKRRSEIIQRKAENQIIYNELTNALMESKNFADYGFEGTEDKKNRLNTKSGKVRNAWYQTLNMARKAQILDNNEKGTFYNLLIRKKRILQNSEMEAVSKRANLIQDSIKENNLNPDTLYKTWTMNLEDGRTVTFTTSELAYIYLSQYCQENRDALAYGTFVSLDEKSTFQKSADSVIIGQGKSLIEARENKVNDDIRQLGDWRYNEALSLAKTVIEGDKGLYNLVKAIESDFNSPDFQRVIDLTRKIYNVDIKKEDYYLPLNRTDFLGKDPGEDIKNDLLNTVPGTRGVVEKGFTKERNKTISPLHQKAIKYDLFKVWTDSVKKQEHFIAMQEYINQLNSLFVDGDKAKLLRSRIENTYGKTMLENLDEYIKEVANPDAGALQLDPTKDILNAAKGNIYAAYLGFKLSSITNQLITSPAAFLGKVSPIRLASNLLQMTVHYKSISEEVFELSPFMKSRNFDLIAGEIKESSEKLGLNKAQRGWNKFLEVGLKGLEFADQFSVVAGWKAIFDQELEKLGDSTTEENIKTAAAIADEYVYETQPLSDKSEIAPLFKNKSGFTNIMLQFQTSLNVVWNNLAYDTVQDFKKKNWRKALGTVFGYAMAGSLLSLAHGEFKPDDDDDEDEKLKKFWLKFGYSTLSQGIESIPIFSNAIDPIFRYIVTDEKPSYTSNMITPFPFIANASEATKYTVQAIREKDTEALTKAVDKGADAFMLALGLPYSGIREIEAIKDVGAQALLGERK